MNRKLGGRKREDEPSVTRINEGQAQHIAEECAISLRIAAVDQKMYAVDHRRIIRPSSEFGLSFLSSFPKTIRLGLMRKDCAVPARYRLLAASIL
jgi:hypothetical protein